MRDYNEEKIQARSFMRDQMLKQRIQAIENKLEQIEEAIHKIENYLSCDDMDEDGEEFLLFPPVHGEAFEIT